MPFALVILVKCVERTTDTIHMHTFASSHYSSLIQLLLEPVKPTPFLLNSDEESSLANLTHREKQLKEFHQVCQRVKSSNYL